MKCLYDVLGVEQSADDSSIRSAYKKLALKWHPDKNQENLANAEEHFKEVQNAYEILSDKHERAWYDSHRDAILRSGERHQAGGTGGFEGGVRPDDEVDLYPYFSATCYNGFGDGPRGFYSVYDELFNKIAEQEGTSSKMPRFGSSTSAWADVSTFYNEWSGFRTTKSFSWADEYNTAAAPNRKVRRAMDQENEKARKALKKEYNENVRELVEFLRKRDKRVIAHQVEQARLRAEREAADKARREAERLERLEKARQFKEAAWAADPEESSDEEEPYAEEEQLLYYCVACEKHFKSEAALANHEKSKKHKENLEILRYQLEQDELGLDEGIVLQKSGASAAEEEELLSKHSAAVGEEEDYESSDDSDSEISEESSSSSSLSDDEDGDDSSDDSENKSSKSTSESESESSEEEEDLEEDDDAMLERLIISRTRQQDSSSEASSSASEDESQDEEELAATPALNEASSDDEDWGKSTKGGRRKGAKAKSQPSGNNQPKPPAASKPVEEETLTETVLSCSVCGENFKSRNKLFGHIKKTGHAALKNV